MDYNYLLVEKEEGIVTLSINREKSLNALNPDVVAELGCAFAQIEKEDDVDVVILTGKGRAFVAGADITHMAKLSNLESGPMAKQGQDVFRSIETLKVPVIAAINGFALGGGCELAMSCDIRIASTKAKLGQPETGLGIIPGYGGTQRLPRLVGMGKAKELIFTSAIIDAQEAYRIGLVDQLVEPEALMEEALKLAKTIQTKSRIAVSAAKRAINIGMQVDIDSGMVVEEALFSGTFATEDRVEGMNAFVEKRPAEFKNK